MLFVTFLSLVENLISTFFGEECKIVCVLSRVQLFMTPWTVTHQAPLSMGFSRQEFWIGLPFPPPGDLPDPVIEPTSLAALHCRWILYQSLSHQGIPNIPQVPEWLSSSPKVTQSPFGRVMIPGLGDPQLLTWLLWDFWELSFTVLALRRCPSPECVVWVAGGVVPAFLPEGSRESHGMFTPSNDRRPNNKQPKCTSGKGWAITENNSWIAVPASCWGGGQPVLAASPRGARPSLRWDIYGGSLVQAGGQSRNQGCQLHHPRDCLQFTKHLWVRLITSIHHRSRRENWGIKSWGKFFPRACSKCALSTYCIPALMPGAENTEAKRISSPHGAPRLPSSGGTWRSQSEHPG